jgi:predicted nucleotide-binding protein
MSRKKSAGHPNLAAALKKRFEGAEGHRLLLESLKEQKMVAGNTDLALEIASKGELIAVPTGKAVIEQGGEDNHIFLILAGTFNIVANGKLIAKRYASDHIGEMAAVQPSQSRSTTVIATENSVLLKLTEPQLAALGAKYSEIYRLIAKELAKRLLQRNSLLGTKRDKIHVFIVSSAEALDLARTIQNAFELDPYDVVIWTDGVFRASHYAIESLERELDQSDFAIAIAQPDDSVRSRGKNKRSPRDNVIFELGLFIGRLGRHRSLLLEPRWEAVKLPSDLTGLTTIPYKHSTGTDLATALGPACNKIRAIINELGPNN